jgi:hypothetical protein
MARKKRSATTKKAKAMPRRLSTKLKTLAKRAVDTLKDGEVRTMRMRVGGRGAMVRVGATRGDLSRVDADPINGGDQPTYDRD